MAAVEIPKLRPAEPPAFGFGAGPVPTPIGNSATTARPSSIVILSVAKDLIFIGAVQNGTALQDVLSNHLLLTGKELTAP